MVVLTALTDDEEAFGDGSSFAFVITLSWKTLKSVWQPFKIAYFRYWSLQRLSVKITLT